MSRSSDYHSNHRMHISRKGYRTTPRPTGFNNHDNLINRQGPKTTAQSENTAQEIDTRTSHNTGKNLWDRTNTDSRFTEGRNNNRRQENNKQHEQPTKHENEGGTTTTRTNEATHTRSSTLPPQRRVELYVGRQTTTRTKNKTTQQQRREKEDPQRGVTNCTMQTNENTDYKNRKNNKAQEKTRLPSTALLAQGALV